MKTQFKISYFTAKGLKDSFYEFHSKDPQSDYALNIVGGYMKDVTEVKVEATGFNTDNIEDARLNRLAQIINFLNGDAAAPSIEQSELDALGIKAIAHNGITYHVIAGSVGLVANQVSEYYQPHVTAH